MTHLDITLLIYWRSILTQYIFNLHELICQRTRQNLLNWVCILI